MLLVALGIAVLVTIATALLAFAILPGVTITIATGLALLALMRFILISVFG